MSKVIIDIHDKSKEKALIDFLKSIPFIAVQEKETSKTRDSSSFKKMFGLWKGRDINLKDIRSKAWDRSR